MIPFGMLKHEVCFFDAGQVSPVLSVLLSVDTETT